MRFYDNTRAERRSLPLRENEQHRCKIAAIAHTQVLQRTRKSLTKISCSHVNAGQAGDENNTTNGAMTDTVSSSPIGDPHSTCTANRKTNLRRYYSVWRNALTADAPTLAISASFLTEVRSYYALRIISPSNKKPKHSLSRPLPSQYCSNKRAAPTPQQKRFKVNARVQACIITAVS